MLRSEQWEVLPSLAAQIKKNRAIFGFCWLRLWIAYRTFWHNYSIALFVKVKSKESNHFSCCHVPSWCIDACINTRTESAKRSCALSPTYINEDTEIPDSHLVIWTRNVFFFFCTVNYQTFVWSLSAKRIVRTKGDYYSRSLSFLGKEKVSCAIP